MNRSVSVGIVALVVALAAVLGAPAAMAETGVEGSDSSPGQQPSIASPTGTESQSQFQSAQSIDSIAQSQDFDQTTFEITVHENGSATWTFRHEQRFDTENESAERTAFEEFAEEFESEETGLYERFTEQARAMTESGAELTGREMDATNFRRSARVDDQWGGTRGIVEMTFTWEGFAEVDDGRVEVGDVFEDIYITEDQAIEIEPSDGLSFRTIEPEDDAQYQGDSVEGASSVYWSGERQFLDNQPRVVFVQEGVDQGSVASWQLAVGALLVLVIGGGVVWYHRRWDADGGDGATPDVAAEPDEPAAAGAGAASATATAATRDEADESSAAAADAEPESEPEPEPLTDEELLTDEDRVVKLIRENGGRMKQVNIVEETGWSKSKVSMLLSDMEDEGTISKLRVGRENIISLEGFEPEATKSPFEE